MVFVWANVTTVKFSHAHKCACQTATCGLQGLALYKLSGQLSTRQSCQAAVTAAAIDPCIHTAIFTINMQQTSQRQVSMLRAMIDEVVKDQSVYPVGEDRADDMVTNNVPVQDRNVILVLHHPPGDLIVNQYPALFLHGWNFWYLDSFASHAQTGSGSPRSEGLQWDSWLQAAADWDATPAAASQATAGQ